MLNKEITITIDSLPDDRKTTIAAIIYQALRQAGLGSVTVTGMGEDNGLLALEPMFPNDTPKESLSHLTARIDVKDSSSGWRRLLPKNSEMRNGPFIKEWIEQTISSAVTIWTKDELLTNVHTRLEHRRPVGKYCLVFNDQSYLMPGRGEAMSMSIFNTEVGKNTGLVTFRFSTLHQIVDNESVDHLLLIVEATTVRGESPTVTRRIPIPTGPTYLRAPGGADLRMPEEIIALFNEIVAI